MSGLSVRAQVTLAGVTRLDLSLHAEPGSVIAVVGPNGAGKSTLLRTVAGLVELSTGSKVMVDGHDLTRAAPALRRVAYVPQDGALFPHLTVLDNVAYGVRASGEGRRAARTQAREHLQRLNVADLADRPATSLSGGQSQRVALARALATHPKVLLLDEPTGSLDAVAKTDVQSLLRHHVRDFPGVTLLVTHDPSEALTVASRVVVLDDGSVVQDDTPERLVRSPGSAWLAKMLNLNAWPGHVRGRGIVELEDGGQVSATDLPGVEVSVLVTASPTSLMLYTHKPSSSARNAWPATVTDVHPHGERVRVSLDAARPGEGPARAVAEVTVAAISDLNVAPGSLVWAAVKATDLTVSPM
ncbi:MAG: ABC transporter ATP-binding protein [Actinomycetes bacterium]